MSAPNFPRAYTISRDSAILDTLNKISIAAAKQHFNAKENLYSSNASDTTRDHNFWSRGCGWGIGALCRIHEYLPKGHYSRAFYEDKIRLVLGGLIKLQNKTDGMWRSDLTHPDVYPNKESSGTAFFCFALFYAINNGIVDSATYLGPAKAAWKGLLGCIGADAQNPNLIGWSQGVGGSPSGNSASGNAAYTEGAFFLAGKEFYKFLNPSTAIKTPSSETVAMRSGAAAARYLCLGGSVSRLVLPPQVSGVELFSLSGRKVYEQKNILPGTTSLMLPEHLIHRGAMAVRFRYYDSGN
jgi:hypothetical protein